MCKHSMAKRKPLPADQSVRVLRLRLKDKHAPWLRELASEVNLVWNYVNDLSFKVWERERRFVSAFNLHPYVKGASHAGLNLHSQTLQAVTEEFVTRRKQFKKLKLRWRVSNPLRSNYSLGWIPFKAVLDTGWSTFRAMLKYKCDDAGAWFAQVNEAYSTQDCHVCGTRCGPSGLEGLAVRATSTRPTFQVVLQRLEQVLRGVRPWLRALQVGSP